jgi:hypothetical protein
LPNAEKSTNAERLRGLAGSPHPAQRLVGPKPEGPATMMKKVPLLSASKKNTRYGKTQTPIQQPHFYIWWQWRP